MFGTLVHNSPDSTDYGFNGHVLFVNLWKTIKFGRVFCGRADLVPGLVVYGPTFFEF